MASERVLQMNGGEGETSYTKNSLLQVSSLFGFRKQSAYKIDRVFFLFSEFAKMKRVYDNHIYIYIYIPYYRTVTQIKFGVEKSGKHSETYT